MNEHPSAAVTRAVPCLADLTDEEAAAAAPHLLIRCLAPGEVLFRQGDPGDSVYVLVSGDIEIRVPGKGGEHELATIGPGTFVGEFALLADTRRIRSVVACSQAELWELPRADFESALESGDPWATRFLMSVARELVRQMLAVDGQIAALMEDDRDQPPARVRELEKLRRQLSGEWTF